MIQNQTQPTQQEELGELAFSILRPALTLLNPSKKEVVELNNCLLKLKSLWQRETRDEVLREIDSQFLAKSHMVVSGLHGDLFQIKKQDWNDIRKSIIEQTK